jgi:hypothetical protein
MSIEETQSNRFLISLLSAFLGVALIGLSIYLGMQNDFLANVILFGGNVDVYVEGLIVSVLLISGVVLVGRHVWLEGAESTYIDHMPY